MKQIFFITILATILTSCGSKQKEKADHSIYIYQNINLEDRIMNFDNTRKEGDAYAGRFYSGVDSTLKYGVGYATIIEDSLKKYPLIVYVSAYIRERELPIDGGIAVTLSVDQNNKFWNVIKPKTQIAGQWVLVKDSFNISPELMKGNVVEFAAFSIKDKGADNLDVDNLEIKYKFKK